MVILFFMLFQKLCELRSQLSFLQLTIVLRMDDKMNRQLTCSLTQEDSPSVLAQELVHYGFINDVSIPRTFLLHLILITVMLCHLHSLKKFIPTNFSFQQICMFSNTVTAIFCIQLLVIISLFSNSMS